MSRASFAAAAVAVGGIVAAGYGVIDFHSPVTETLHIDRTERVSSGSGEHTSHRYMVWATRADGRSEVFENTDSKLHWKFNSADVYGRMDRGATVQARVYGWRVPIFSMNRNIISASPVSGSSTILPTTPNACP